MQMKLTPRLTKAMDLGSLVSQHPVSKSSRWISLIVGLVSLGGTLLLLWAAVSTYLDLSSRYGPGLGGDYPPKLILPALLAVVTLLGGLWILFDTLRHWNTVAAIYEHGLALADYSGLQQVRWEAVDSVSQSVTRHYRNGRYTHTTYVYTVQTNTGQKLRFDSKLVQIEALGDALQRQVLAILLPRYTQALHSGQRLTFGPMALDRDSLYTGNKSLAWREVKTIKIERGAISIESEAGVRLNKAPVAVAQVPNFWIFYQIASQLTQVV